MVLLGLLAACAEPVESDVDTDQRVPATPEPSPGVDKTTYVRLMNHVWDRYGTDATRGIHVRIPPTNPVTLLPPAGSAFPTGGNTGYVDLFDAGTYEAGVYDDDALLLDIGDLAVEAGGFYTLDAFGVAGFGVLGSTFLRDDPTPPSAGSAKVRVVHTATGVPTFDVWTGGSKVSDDVPYGGTSAYFEIPIGVFSVGYDLTQDGNPDVTCVGQLAADDFLEGTPPVLHAVVPPSATTYLGGMYLYIFGGADHDEVQAPIGALCHLGP